ncbi:hypothetical protein BC332_29481 [Capsicum chinense]|nr:hypothetical protein BC332_29481 [Capsicum chinense]
MANGWCCYCCWKEERTALLQLKANIKYSASNEDYLSSWGANETSGCCRWDGIVCSNTTRRVIELSIAVKKISKEEQLSTLYGTYTDDILRNWLFNASLFVPFKNLKALLLPGHSLAGWVKNEGSEKLRHLRKIESLDLSWNGFNRSIFQSLNQFSSLTSLNLANNKIASGPERLSGLDKLEILDLSNNALDDENGFAALGLCDLKYLEELSLSRNKFIGRLPACLGNLTFLRVIDLTLNWFTGNIASSPLSRLLSLEYLLIANNNFEIPISFETFANHSKLKFIFANENSVIGETSSNRSIPKFQLEALTLSNCSQIPSFLHYQHHLRLLGLSRCNIGGDFPNWLLENNSRLGEVHLDGNAFTGSLQLPFRPKMRAFDISNNKIQGELPTNIGSIFPNLFVSIMFNNMLEGLLPSSFADMKNLACLDLSYNKLKGQIPIRLGRKGSKIYVLKLSNNLLEGEIFPVLANISNLQYLYLDGNNFSGPIPQALVTAPFLSILDLSDNNFSGNIPSWLGNISSLRSLALSRNHLMGHIPPDYCRLEQLEVLDLSENNLVGVIPSCFSAFQYLKHVHLSKNNLQGEFNMFSNSSYLQLLDLGDNNFSGSIPKWLGSTSDITILLLRGNRLQGTIPPLLCHARCLRMLDISHNNLSGPIPHCLANITQQAWKTIISEYLSSFGYEVEMFVGDAVIDEEFLAESSSMNMFLDYNAWVRAEFTTKYNTYSYKGLMADYMCGIDLSYNELSGEIPKELGNLTEIHALNLSHNHLTGAIPSEFSNLQNIESLDLSYNNLTGSIPTQLLKLTTLAVFTVSNNNLTGRTPQRSSQFATFTESSYEGNPFLCGLPLNISCTEAKEIPIYPPAPNYCEDDASFLDMEAFYISFLVAYTNVVVAVVVVLWLKANIKYSTSDDYLSSWGANETTNCCGWEGIVCSNTTRRVIELSFGVKKISQEEQLSTLNGTYTDNILRNWLFNASLFVPFKNLKALLLPGHSLAGWVKNEGFEKLRRLRKLEVLDLTGNNFNRSILESVSQLSSLKSLNLSHNQIGSGSDIGFGYNKPGSGSERLSGLDKLEILDLSSNNLDHEHVLSVLDLNTSRMALKKLDLRYNRFQSFMPNEDLGALRNIEYLLLDGNTLDENFLRSSGVMSSLKVLSVAECNLNGTLPLQGLCDLKYLEELSLSRNSFIGTLPTCLGNLTYLRVIDLTQNQFTGNIASSPLSSLFSLEYLLIANNNFEIPISFESFANHSKLKFVIADYNSVIVHTTSKSWIPKFQLEALSLFNCSQMPNFLHYQHHLRLLRLSRCNIGGDFPNWLLENNSRLGEVYLDGNAFGGSLQSPFLPNLKALDISNNKIRGPLPPNIGSIFPNLVISTMSNNMLEGMLPSSFADMKNLECLDLSYNKLNGELPIGLAREGSKLYLLRLSNNMLKGEIFPVSGNINNFRYLYLDGNNFSGPIPQKLSTTPLQTLDLSYNNLSGNIPAWLGNISSLTSLALSKNHLKGHIPPDYCRLERLEVLDLSENNLVGVIPTCFSAFRELKRVYLSKNKLQGEFNMFSNSYLKVLDLRYNNFSGSIPKWLGSLGITTLLLKGNHLQGTIPTELCRASELRIMDISHNNLSGPIPRCVGNIMQQALIIEPYPYSTSFGYPGFQTFGGDTMIDVESSIKSSSPIMFLNNYAWVGAEFMTKHNTYSYEGSIVDDMSGIDLSCNQLSAELPKELSNLTQIRALNLSHNHITGMIPSEFSNLQNIESLDLSYNNLIGRIPTQILELTTLAVFSVAHNNLTGRTPQRAAQFATFNESCYEGNPFLCGLPLHISCTETKEVPISPLGSDCCEDDTGFLDIESFYISFLVAYANVVLVTVVVLSLNPYWRNIWFYYVESFMYSCYYFFSSKM